MTNPSGNIIITFALTCISLTIAPVMYTQKQSQDRSKVQKETTMSKHATGTFEVKLTPQTSDDKNTKAAIGRWTLDKQFHGAMEGTSHGEMLAVGSASGSGGYVAMEEVTARLDGRQGTFALQHSGTMERGKGQIRVTVVPDSGTGELVGLTGQMSIEVNDGKHSYDFEYQLPSQ